MVSYTWTLLCSVISSRLFFDGIDGCVYLFYDYSPSVSWTSWCMQSVAISRPDSMTHYSYLPPRRPVRASIVPWTRPVTSKRPPHHHLPPCARPWSWCPSSPPRPTRHCSYPSSSECWSSRQACGRRSSPVASYRIHSHPMDHRRRYLDPIIPPFEHSYI